MTRRTIIALAAVFAVMLAASTLLSSPQRKAVAIAPVVAQNHEEAADFLHEQRVEASNTTTTTVAERASRSYNRFAGSLREVGTHVNDPSPATAGTSGNSAKLFIYMHESGNNPCAYNPGKSDCAYPGHAACGLGGANPCDKLRAVCSMSDYACQDNWFTNSYMVPRYGTWEKAKAFWLRWSWW